MQSFFKWLSENWTTACAWAGGLYVVYQLGSVVTAFVNLIFSVVTRIKTAESTLKTMATNHLPHLQVELEKANGKQDKTHEILVDIREVLLLTMADRKRDRDDD
jgi:hypothetical protein